jgi:uncharacterized membrane protein YhaH (DUF805 family)
MDNHSTSNKFLSGFEGRINRAKYANEIFSVLIGFPLCLALLALVLSVVFGTSVKSVHFSITDIFNDPPSFPFSVSFGDTGAAWLASLLFHVFAAPIVVEGIRMLAVGTIKRLHDRNKSGWLIVPFFIAPVLLNKMAGWLGDTWPGDFLMLVAIALGLWCFVEMLCLQGTMGPNRFGPDPLALRPVNRSPRPAPDWDRIRALKFVPHGAGPSAGPHVNRKHD